MKILFFFPEANVPNKAGSYAHHNLRAPLIKLGHEIIDFDFTTDMKGLGRYGMLSKLREVLEKEKPEVFFHGIVEDEMDKELADLIKDRTATTSLVLFSDDDWRFNHSVQWADHYNFALTQCHEAYEKFRLRGLGNVIMTQWGCNTDIYYPVETEKQYDVTFVGQPYLGRPELVTFLNQSGIDIRVWGAGWENFPAIRDIAHGLQPHFRMLEGFSASKIVLGMGWCSADGRTPQIKGRLFEYAACRAFQLTNYDKRVTEYFKEGEEILFYRDKYDLADKIRYYLDHDDERERIAGAAYSRALKEHTWEQRFHGIFSEMMKNLPEGKAPLSERGEKGGEAYELKQAPGPKVSVVTYTYNFAEYLDEMIQSVLGQTYRDFEFLVLDDGSTDNTAEVVAGYKADPRLRYVYQENTAKTLGFDEMIRRVVAMTTGEYIAFIGGDDRFLPDKLRRQVREFEADPDLDIVFSDLYFIDGEGKPLGGDFRCEESLTFTHRDLLRNLFRKNFIAHPSVMIKRKAIAGMGGFETRFAPDFHFWVKSAPYLNFKFIDEKLLKYRVHEKGASTGGEMRETCFKESIKAGHELRGLFTILDFYPEIELCLNKPRAVHDAYIELGALFLTGNLPLPGLALAEFRRALQQRPDSLRALNNIGIANIFLGNVAKAHETFQALASYPGLHPTMAGNIETVTRIMEGRSSDTADFGIMHEEVEESELLRKIAALKNGVITWPERKAGVRSESGDENRAFTQMYGIVESLAADGKVHEAIAVLEKLVALYPKNAMLLSDMGVLHFQTGDKEKAITYVQQALVLEPGQRDARMNLAALYLETDRVSEAVGLYKTLLEEDPGDVEVLTVLAEISVRLGSRDDALIFYGRVLERDPGNVAAEDGIRQLGAASGS